MGIYIEHHLGMIYGNNYAIESVWKQIISLNVET